jgi:AraC-like DNA-binding protein
MALGDGGSRRYTRAVLTHGLPLESLRLPDLTLTEVQYGRGDTYGAHSHDRAYVLLLIEGGFHEEAAADAHDATSGSVLLMPAGCRHVNRIAPGGARGLLVTLEPTFARAIPRFRGFYRGDIPRTMLKLYANYRHGGAAETLAIEEQLLEATTRAAGVEEHEVSDGGRVKRVRELLDETCGHPLRLGDVARQAGVTAAHLARAFRRTTGETMGDYLRGARARKAAALLSSTGVTLADAAMQAGFADPRPPHRRAPILEE